MKLSGPQLAAAVAGAVALGAGIGSAIAATTPVRYHATANVLVTARGGPSVVDPLLPNLRALATSSVVAGDVTSTLHIAGSIESFRKRISASTPPHTQVVAVSLSDANADRARQVTQEVAVVFAQLVHARFRPANATVLDPAHVVSRSGPDYLGNALIGAAIGLAVALAAGALTRRPISTSAPSDAAFRRRERQLQQRITTVTARETALARRAAELAVRERGLERVAAPVTEPEPEVGPERFAVPSDGWTLDALERLVGANSERFPDQADEWHAYLFYLRDYTDAHGRIPQAFDPLIEDAFSALIN